MALPVIVGLPKVVGPGSVSAPIHLRTAIPCRAFGLGTMIDAQLVYHHQTGDVTLEADCMIRYVELWSVYTTTAGNRVAILRTENNIGWHIPAEAWEAIQKERA